MASKCFCGRPSAYDDGIYCTRECAREDSLASLEGREPKILRKESDDEFDPNVVTHYRKHMIDKKKAAGPGVIPITPKAVDHNVSSTDDGDAPEPQVTPVKSCVPNAAISASASARFYMDKPLPDIPHARPPEPYMVAGTAINHNLLRQFTGRYPGPTTTRPPATSPSRTPRAKRTQHSPKDQHPHMRNSSLSSFVDSLKRSGSLSTRATSVASSKNGHGLSRSVSDASTRSGRPRIRLGGVSEEAEGSSQTNSRTNLAKMNITGLERIHGQPAATPQDSPTNAVVEKFTQFASRRQDLPTTSPNGTDTPSTAAPFPVMRMPPPSAYSASRTSRAETEDDMESHYDPFELDQLMRRTPPLSNIRFPGSASPNTTEVPPASAVPPLSLPRRPFGERDPSVLAPPVEIVSVSKVLSASASSTSLTLPHQTGYNSLQLPSPGAFPTTPSFSPFVPTPTVSPSAARVPAPDEKTKYTLRRVAHTVNSSTKVVACTPIVNVRVDHGMDSAPITPADQADEGAANYSESDPVVGPGRPLFLGLGLDVDLEDEGPTEVRRRPRPGRAPRNEDIEDRQDIDTVFQVRDQLRRAITAPSMFSTKLRFWEEDLLTHYSDSDKGDDDHADDDRIKAQVASRI